MPSLTEFSNDIAGIYEKATAPAGTPMTIMNDMAWGTFEASTNSKESWIVGQKSYAKAKITKIVKSEKYELKKTISNEVKFANGHVEMFKSVVDDNEAGNFIKMDLLVQMHGTATFIPDEVIFEGVKTPIGAPPHEVPGKIIIKPTIDSSIISKDSMIVGNTVLYGAISGECYFSGIAGERFCVRNSGAIAVIEGVGDHGCEYMTGGIVLCLGKIGRNFAAGMSGGIAYIYDPDDKIHLYLNNEMVEIEDLNIIDSRDFSNYESISHMTQNMLEGDDLKIKYLIERHIKYTSSDLANSIIKNWDKSIKYFKKIMPIDYKNVLVEQKKGKFSKIKIA